MAPTKAQKMMIEDGAPASIVLLTQEERKAAWDANPPKPMPSFMQPRGMPPEVLKRITEEKKTKTKNRIAKMLIKKEDHTGQRWDPNNSRWIKEEDPMISITTNTRGVSAVKSMNDMSLKELTDAYNKISGKSPIKAFKSCGEGIKRLTALNGTKGPTGPLTGRPLSEIVRKAKSPKAEGSENKRAAEFGARVGSFRERLIIALDENFKRQVTLPDLLKAVYGSKNTENIGALGMVIKGAMTTIEKNSLPYQLKKEKNEAKEISFGLFPK